ncbi:UV-endonuclease UvdE-domain-containing protein [Melanogaster broomeanus]|nr:UV-endonuclease UvdE-domain-containing protein [Melanogaster broomeanus]
MLSREKRSSAVTFAVQERRMLRPKKGKDLLMREASKRSQVAGNAVTIEGEEEPQKKKRKRPALQDEPVIDSIKKNGMDWVKDLGRQNAQDLLKIIEWNEQNTIRFMRISSEMFPFASHEIYGYSLNYCAPLLAQVGALAKKYEHRITTHPGQFTQLGSPREAVVHSSIRELEYHAEMLDLMGVDQDGVMVIHGGGVYGNKEAALARIKKVCYTAADLLPVCTELDVPLHYSEPKNGAVGIMELRAHSGRCQSLPEGLPDDMDLMIEAKDKEQAVLQLYRVYGLHPVIQCGSHKFLRASLRPPIEKATGENKSRKSVRKPRSRKAAGS